MRIVWRPTDGPRTALARGFAIAAVLLLLALLAGCIGALAPSARAQPAWTTYHHDPQRSGEDPDAVEPLAPIFAWQSSDLGAPIWGQPLVLGSRTYVATIGDMIYALDSTTGAVVWAKSVGIPVPSSALPCGDVVPTVGIVGTPLIDPSSNVIYAVADTWDAGPKEAHHLLVGLALANGEELSSTPVDPPGADPKTILQRTALNIDQGNVIFGYGGNDGDCGVYRGAVVAAPEGSGQPRFWQTPIAPPSSGGGAVWATSGPTVTGDGRIYAATGNPNPSKGEPAVTYDYSDSVVKLDLAQSFVAEPASQPAPLGWFEPPNWKADSNSDLDLSSAGPEPLPGGLLFQAGKDGVGHLIDQATMGSGAEAVYSGAVCGGHGSFGGDAYAGGVIYIPCTSGVQALAYDQQARTFTPLWKGPADAFGPPILSAGLVWTLATGGFSGGGNKLYGLDAATGKARYTETLPSKITDHFSSPSAAGGRLLVSSGSSVTAYQIAKLGASEGLSPSTGTSASSGSAGNAPGATVTSAVPATALARALLRHTRLQMSAQGRVPLSLRCTVRTGSCVGVVTLRAKVALPASGRRAGRVVLLTLAHARYSHARGDFALTVRLDAAARAHLKLHHGRLVLQVVISSPRSRSRRVAAVLTQAPGR